jgi:hypothetical protein
MTDRIDWTIEQREQIDRAIALSGLSFTGVIKTIVPCVKCKNRMGKCSTVLSDICSACGDTKKNWQRG